VLKLENPTLVSTGGADTIVSEREFTFANNSVNNVNNVSLFEVILANGLLCLEI